MFAAMTQPAVDLPGLRGQAAQAHGLRGPDPVGLDDGMLAVRRRCTGGGGCPGRRSRFRDVRAGDGVLPAGLQSVRFSGTGGRLHAAGGPPQAVRPVPGAAHQVGDLRDVLVVLGGAVLGGAGLPRARGDLLDCVLVGGGDHPPAGEQHHPARGGHRQQVSDELVAGGRPRRRG